MNLPSGPRQGSVQTEVHPSRFPYPHLFNVIDSLYLAYRNGQSVELTVIGNPVFILLRDLSFPYHVINGTKVITAQTFYSVRVACNM